MHYIHLHYMHAHLPCHCMVQWNPYIAANLGNNNYFGCYIGVAFIEGLFCIHIFHLGGVPLYIVHLYNILLSIIKLS